MDNLKHDVNKFIQDGTPADKTIKSIALVSTVERSWQKKHFQSAMWQNKKRIILTNRTTL